MKDRKYYKISRETVEEVAQEMCTKFCKYPDQWDEEAEECELSESEICSGCPLNRLEG